MNENNGKEPSNEPQNPMGALLEAAVSMHELYLSFVEAGFTEAQALHLVSQSLRPQSPN